MAKKKSSSRSALGRNPFEAQKARKNSPSKAKGQTKFHAKAQAKAQPEAARHSARVASPKQVSRSASPSRQRLSRAREVLQLFLNWLTELFSELKRWALAPISA
jgi:hypothetical protein